MIDSHDPLVCGIPCWPSDRCCRGPLEAIARERRDPNRAPVEGAQCPLCGQLEWHVIDCPDNLERDADPHPDYDRDPDPAEARRILAGLGIRFVERVRGWWSIDMGGRPGWRPGDYPDDR